MREQESAEGPLPDDADADGLKVWICVRVGGRGWAWVGGLVLIVRSRKY